jgi:hypothetical protein
MKARASDFTILSFDDDISECMAQFLPSTSTKLNIDNNNNNNIIIQQSSSLIHSDITSTASTSLESLHDMRESHKPLLASIYASYDQATILSASLYDHDVSLESSEYDSPTNNLELANDTSQSTSILSRQQQQKNQPQQQQQTSYDIPIIEAPLLHQSYQNWIIFSDLHVKSSSIETCEQVLHDVHDDAMKRNAGIIFLGDFWHVRGTLSVELLNRVLKELNKWTQPVIMIPGKHDC